MPIFYAFTNKSVHYKTIAIRDFRFAFEKVVLPNQTIIFQSLPDVTVEICSFVDRLTAMSCERIPCDRLGDE